VVLVASWFYVVGGVVRVYRVFWLQEDVGWCGRSLAGVCGVVVSLATLPLLEENCGWRNTI